MIILLLTLFSFLQIYPTISKQEFNTMFNNPAFLRQIKAKTVQELYELSRLWISTDIKSAKRSINRLEQQKLSSKIRVKVLILKSFISLKTKAINLAVSQLKQARKLLKKERIKNKELEQFIIIQIARIYAINKDLTNSLKYYQNINKNSRYYKDALTETVWLLSKSSGDYKNTIEHIDALIIWHDTYNTKFIPPNDREVLDLILEKAKTYLKVLDLERATNAYKEFLEKYRIIKPKYTELPDAKFTGDFLLLNKCKSKLKNAPLMLFSKRCIKDDFLNVWLSSKEKLLLIKEIKIFNFFDTRNLINPYTKQKYKSLLVNYINANIQTANARLRSKKLEAKTGILQISIALKDINKSKNKKLLEQNYRKLNRLENIYNKLLTD